MSTAYAQPIPFSDARWKQEVRERIDLREIIDGIDRDGKVLCPFHDDHHPSLHIYRDGFKCYSCGAKGDVFAWLQKTRGLTFPEAKKLAGELARLDAPATAPRRTPAPRSAPIHAPEPATRPAHAPTFAAFCAARRLDPQHLRDVWGVTEGRHCNRPALLYPVPSGPRRVKYLDGKGADGRQPKYMWERKGGKKQWYGLAQAATLPPGPLYIVNGEPSVWAAQQADVRAVCIAAGEGAEITPAQVQQLMAAGYSDVRVIYDNDDTGRGAPAGTVVNGRPIRHGRGAYGAVESLRAGGIDAHAYQLPADLGEHADVGDLHRRVGNDGLAAALAALPEMPEPAPPAPSPHDAAFMRAALAGERDGIAIAGHPGYVMREGRIDLERMRGGKLEHAVFLSCCPVVREVVYIHGAEPGQRLHYHVAADECDDWISYAALDTREGLERLRMPGIASRSTRALIADVITQLADGMQETPGVNVLGVHEIGGAWRYVFPDGHTLPPLPDDGRVYVAGLPEGYRDTYTARRMVFDGRPASTRGEMIDALDFMAAVSPERGYAMLTLAAAARALLYGIIPSRTFLVLEGDAGHGKTSIANFARGLVLSAYSEGRYEETATGKFNDTITRLETKVALEASWPVLIDDVAQKDNETPAKASELMDKIDRIGRSAFDGLPIRDRATRDMQARPSNYVHTLPIITAQALDASTDTSLIGRMVLMQVEDGDINRELMKDLGADFAPLLLALGDHIIGHWMQRVNDDGKAAVAAELHAQHQRYARALHDDLVSALGRRLPDNVDRLPVNGAHLLVGLHAVGDALGMSGALADEYRPLLVQVLTRQVPRIERKGGSDGDGPATALMQALADRIARGVPISGGRPWRIAQRSPGPGPEEPPRASYADGTPWPEHSAGWRPGLDEPLIVTAAYADAVANALYLTRTWREEMRALAAKVPGCAGLAGSDIALSRALDREGWFIEPAHNGKRNQQLRHRGGFERVWAVRLDKFLGSEPDGADDLSLAIAPVGARLEQGTGEARL